MTTFYDEIGGEDTIRAIVHRFVAAAQEAWELVNFASVEDDDAVWKEVFGPGFKVED